MASSSPFATLPVSGIAIPSTPLVISALEYTKTHTSPTTVNHCLRSTAFALIISKKIPPLHAVNIETVALSVIMHDLGWATTKDLLSNDKRFEVDGANLAKAFLQGQALSTTAADAKFDDHRLNAVWDAIALHTTPSISLNHPVPDVAATAFGITADFLGPNMPGGLVSVQEFQEVVTAFPRLNFGEEVKEIMCNLCRHKPDTTYDNFVSQFGVKFLDGEEGEKFRKGLKEADIVERLIGGLEACKQYE